MARAHILIYGRVQGVFFRKHMKENADKLGLKGWVKNNPDGSVEAIVEGNIEKIKELVKWALTGPPLAHVEKLCVKWMSYKGEFDSFQIIK
uniref:Acylphosphatase n=1 Tax=Fervidicoccus fontis TaxID=683846 RepID=A0A7C1IDJ1_9CREN